MALIKCNKCGKEISDKAKKCIHCGSTTYEKKIVNKNNNFIFILGILICFLGILFPIQLNLNFIGISINLGITRIFIILIGVVLLALSLKKRKN